MQVNVNVLKFKKYNFFKEKNSGLEKTKQKT